MTQILHVIIYGLLHSWTAVSSLVLVEAPCALWGDWVLSYPSVGSINTKPKLLEPPLNLTKDLR